MLPGRHLPTAGRNQRRSLFDMSSALIQNRAGRWQRRATPTVRNRCADHQEPVGQRAHVGRPARNPVGLPCGLFLGRARGYTNGATTPTATTTAETPSAAPLHAYARERPPGGVATRFACPKQIAPPTIPAIARYTPLSHVVATGRPSISGSRAILVAAQRHAAPRIAATNDAEAHHRMRRNGIARRGCEDATTMSGA